MQKKKSYEECRKTLEKVLRISPRETLAHEKLLSILSSWIYQLTEQGDYEQALSVCNELVSLSGYAKLYIHHLKDILTNQGDYYWSKKYYREYISVYESFSQEFPIGESIVSRRLMRCLRA